jgi:phosphatidylserine/phosphatidylglycerophosphate/cardiolipin synthase-like enzyme
MLQQAHMDTRVVFTRTESVAERIESLLAGASGHVDAALYRLESPRLIRSLVACAARGVAVRLVLDRGKVRDTPATRDQLRGAPIDLRLLAGRRGSASKLHHKFAIIDRSAVLTGSYNWTQESEEGNFENLVLLHDQEAVGRFCDEFSSLWAAALPGLGA